MGDSPLTSATHVADTGDGGMTPPRLAHPKGSEYAEYASEERKAALVRLFLSHKGIERAMKKRELISALWGAEAAQDESYNSRYDRSLRTMIEEINAEGGLVCSSSRCGYWWAESLDDGLPAAESLESRALTQLENARRLVRNIKKVYGGQLGLGL